MAGKASKKQVQANLTVLKRLYTILVPIIGLAFLRLLFSNPNSGKFSTWFRFVLSHIPLAGCVYVLDTSGRPRFDSKGKIVKEGMDLSQPGGLTEYMFDLVYLSLFGDIGRIVFNTNKFWYVLVLIPIFAGWKLYNLKNQLMGSSSSNEAAVKGNKGNSASSSSSSADTKSKRQMKREKKGDKVQMKYR